MPPPTAPGSWAAAGTSEKRWTVFHLQVSFIFTPNISVDNFQYVLNAFASTDPESEMKLETLSETQLARATLTWVVLGADFHTNCTIVVIITFQVFSEAETAALELGPVTT